MDTHITELLIAWHKGDKAALEKLIPSIDRELRSIIQRQINRIGAKGVLQTTDMIQEAFINLIQVEQVSWQNRAHFFGFAIPLVKNMLIDSYYRKHKAAKRDGVRVSLSRANGKEYLSAGIVELNDALLELKYFNAEWVRIIELYFYGSLTDAEIAEVLGNTSGETIRRKRRGAIVWLKGRLTA